MKMKHQSHFVTDSFTVTSPVPRLKPRNALYTRYKLLDRSLRFLRFSPLGYPRNCKFKVVNGVKFDGPVVDMDELEEIDDDDLVVETSIIRRLPPALTLEHGLESIREAVEELKLNPPVSGVMRFQVAVPPSAKAFDWFCSQPHSSEVFPLFFLSKESDTSMSDGTRGVFGIGAAVSFAHSSDSKKLSTMRRYLSNDSVLITTYGFMDIDFDTETSIMKREAGSFYFIIPQIELDEHNDVSILAATLAWNDSTQNSFEQAICSFDLSFYQASSHFCCTRQSGYPKSIRALKNLNATEARNAKMVHMNALSFSARNVVGDPKELRAVLSRFYFRFSPGFAITNNMLDHSSENSYSVRDQSNINAVWSSLIIEECTRLGLTYFCIAPGSRSSPLAVAAAMHPLTTCIPCFDERSLAFHAVGYARGSLKPAVIVTTSGTAVSNLLPAVVEASQDFVPLLLLTADRPPELQDAGANQAINQVNHFGSFVRFFFSLPAPTDLIPVRMVLTTIDSAVHWATASPYGPVHINCPFREPLDCSPISWMSSCLNGLDIWISSFEPFTKYVQVQSSLALKNDHLGHINEVLDLIKNATRGILLVGAIQAEDDIWAVFLLAKQLLWPVVVDILSGLRLRKLFSSCPEVKDSILFLDHLDHALLSDSVRNWIHFDVVVQIGSRITSKRICQMLEKHVPVSYILVDSHPFRHDPSHLVTHRIQSSIVQFAHCILKARFSPRRSEWQYHLQTLDSAIAQEISFRVWAECSLTEPYVANVISEALSSESALFVGNSMAIRDADMYGRSSRNYTHSIAERVLSSELPCHWIQVAGNRGASGIDGLLSTSLGFAAGCKKRVLCVIGDMSFLHDTNGLSLLNHRVSRKSVTILVINNHGGAIFSLLPIAGRAEASVLDKFFYTSHNISIEKLCVAHGVKHLQVKTKMELQDALFASSHEDMDSVVEVDSSINLNATFHSTLRKFACQAADHAFTILSRLSVTNSTSSRFGMCQICELKYSLYRIQLCDLPTSRRVDNASSNFYRDGFILSLTLEDGNVGHGEVAPLEFLEESLVDVEEQLHFLVHVLKGANISHMLPLLKGSFSSWICNDLGIPASSIFPSVRCGLEMAVLSAMAARLGSSFFNILHPQTEKKELLGVSPSIRICALLDSKGTPAEVAHIAMRLVKEGFCAIKLKVARQADPAQDAAVVLEVRRKLGPHIELRVDANRNWDYEKAIQFSSLVKSCNLQYIEEPVKFEDDILKYCEESGLHVALDETIDGFHENNLNMLEKYAHRGIVAVVIKPSVVGGFEKAAIVAQWAQQNGKMAVVSAAFESGLGLSAYVLFASYLELQNADISRKMNRDLPPPVAHGLGTYRWLKEDVLSSTLGIQCNPLTGFIEASVANATQCLHKFQMNQDVIRRTSTEEQVLNYILGVDTYEFSCLFKLHEAGQGSDENVVIFLHGFLGTGEDWIPLMKGISGSAKCISVDLPGHGGSLIQNHTSGELTLSVEIIASTIYKLAQQITPAKVTLVGYSMGARIALYMAQRFPDKIKGAVMVSGSPGLKDPVARKFRRAKDDSKARLLLAHGLPLFIDNWYSGDLWLSLKMHPHFNRIVTSRLHHGDLEGLAKILSGLSVGRQPSLWEELQHCKPNILLIVGDRDDKFKQIARQMCDEVNTSKCEMVQIPGCGHAVHLENPLSVLRAVSVFLKRG